LSKLKAALATSLVGIAGLALIMTSEGEVRKTYIDPAGIPTACYGHTGPEIKLGQYYSKQQCIDLLKSDADKHARGVLKCTRVPLNQNQFDALTSFTFNVGVGNYCKSTLARKLNRGDYRGAAMEFPRWNKATVRGKLTVLRGLTTRRAAEQALFLK
jgi:lysozyme